MDRLLCQTIENGAESPSPDENNTEFFHGKYRVPGDFREPDISQALALGI
jgi:hypothetical protein